MSVKEILVAAWRLVGATPDGREGVLLTALVPNGVEGRDLRVVATCATCRWAKNHKQGRESYFVCGNERITNCIGADNDGYCDASLFLIVEPTFGCVQWEGK